MTSDGVPMMTKVCPGEDVLDRLKLAKGSTGGSAIHEDEEAIDAAIAEITRLRAIMKAARPLVVYAVSKARPDSALEAECRAALREIDDAYPPKYRP